MFNWREEVWCCYCGDEICNDEDIVESDNFKHLVFCSEECVNAYEGDFHVSQTFVEGGYYDVINN